MGKPKISFEEEEEEDGLEAAGGEAEDVVGPEAAAGEEAAGEKKLDNGIVCDSEASSHYRSRLENFFRHLPTIKR